ncbi:hypothetical protein [Halostella sp. PRR32]|uniref:hypothetical protein n=1 Tax=Halostella sp. PRR32 TaxID=3098147 RepID=UPI002B1D41FA|nr:hypothetical protein [Halostella sp. PRR32]
MNRASDDGEVHEPPDGEDRERFLTDSTELRERHEKVATHRCEDGDSAEDGLVAGDERGGGNQQCNSVAENHPDEDSGETEEDGSQRYQEGAPVS